MLSTGLESDRGDPTPTDVGFQAQSVFPEDSINVNPSGVRPYLTRGIGFLNEEDWIDDPLPTEPLRLTFGRRGSRTSPMPRPFLASAVCWVTSSVSIRKAA